MKRKLSRYLAVLLAALMIESSCGIEVFAQTVSQDNGKQEEKETQRTTYSGTSSDSAGTTGKEYTPSVTLAATEKYKDMDYSFLKEFNFGTTYTGNIDLTYSNVENMKNSDLYNLKSGAIVRTKGYYTPDDKGGAVYEISTNAATGAEKLENGLYANLIPDTYTDDKGIKWYVTSVKQYGAVGDGVNAENGCIYNNYARLSEYTDSDDKVERGIAYIPEGEYKCDDQLFVNSQNINIVGDGDNTILFTDNDYRKISGYSEHFFTVWGAKNVYFGDFVLQAREVDIYRYMRQFSCIYASDIYINNVDMLIPQECYNCYYYEDKQYSNFCCYSGNKNITVDDCKMVQMTGTYRGANVGVLDIWSSGEENITVMNCDIYGNARDEQIGIFSTDKTSAYVHNVEFINNTVHAYQPKYVNIVGNATMRFTIAYSDSNDINNIHIAGNHFIVECDSKFITFGKLKNCVIEDNIIELMCTYATWSIGIESNTYVNEDDVDIKHNDIFVSTDCNTGKGNLLTGNMKFSNNRVFSDVTLPFGVLGSRQTDNEFIFLKELGYLSSGANTTGNTVYAYQGFGTNGGQSNRQVAYLGNSSAGNTQDFSFSNNTIYNYEKSDTSANFQSLLRIGSNYGSYTISGNKYYAPNVRYEKAGNPACVDVLNDSIGKVYYLRLFRGDTGGKPTVISNNIFQGVNEGGSPAYDNLTYSNNQTLEFSKNLTDTVTSRVDILYKGEPITEITTTGDSIDFDDIEYVATQTDEEGNIISEEVVSNKDITWYTSVEEIGTVSKDGTVSRTGYGTVRVYAVPLDGSTAYGMCKLTFEKEIASEISAKDNITLQPGLRAYADCVVLPEKASQKLIYTSSNPEIAKVSVNGLIEGVSSGETDITCNTTDGSGVKKVIHVTVEDHKVNRIYLNKSKVYLDSSYIGKTYQLSVSSYSPSDSVNKGISRWESTNETIATVSNNGLVTLVGGGSVSIRAYSLDGSCYGYCTLFVQPKAVSNLNVSKTTMSSVSLSWDKQDNAKGYKVYKWDNSASTWILATDTYSSTGCTFNGLNSGETNKYCVRSYIIDYSTYPVTYYEGNDTIITATTDTYSKVTSIYATADYVTLNTGNKPIFEYAGHEYRNKTIVVSAQPTSAETRELDFSIEDPTIATIIETELQTDGSYALYIQGNKPGYTNIIAKSKDSNNMERKIPLGVFDTVKVTNLAGSTEYGKINLSFDGLTDESGIDGYVIRRVQGYRFVDPIYVEKTGDSNYNYQIDKGLTPGGSYSYTVAVYSLKDGIYHERNSSRVDGLTLPETVYVEDLDFGEEIFCIEKGKSLDINAVITPTNASVKNLDWSMDDQSIAKMDLLNDSQGNQYAKVTGVTAGTAYLSVLSTDGSGVVKKVKIIIYDKSITTTKTVCTASNATTGIKVQWNKNELAAGYKIYRKTNSSGYKLIADLTGCEITSYDDTSVTSSNTYTYIVKAYVGKYVSSYNTEGTAIKYLSAPTLSKPVNLETGVKVSWSSVNGATGYKVLRKKAGSGWTQIAVISEVDITSYEDTKISSGTTYAYTIKATSGNYVSGCYTTGNEIKYLSMPKLVSSTNQSNGVKIEWQGVDGATGYKIFRKKAGSGWVQIAVTTDKDVLFYEDTKAVSGTSYSYTVKAYDGVNVSACNTNGLNTKYLSLSTVTNVNNKSDGIQIQWKETVGADVYYVYRLVSGSGWKKIAEVDELSYCDSAVTSGVNYTYKVKAYSGNFSSGYDEISKSITFVYAPALSSIANQQKGINIKWSQVKGANGYEVYRKNTESAWTKIGDISNGSIVNFVDTNVVTGTEYKYALKAKCGDYTSDYSSSEIKMKYLGIPVINSKINISEGIKLQWSYINGADGYLIYRKTINGNWAVVDKVIGGKTLEYIDKSTANGTTYVYMIRSYSGKYISDYLTSGYTTVRLKSPEIKSLVKYTSNSIKVVWSQNVFATGYQIKYVTATTSNSITITDADTLSKVINNLYLSKTYSVYVRCYKTVSGVKYYSDWSNVKKYN